MANTRGRSGVKKSVVGDNPNRKCGKAAKKHPKSNNLGNTGRTKDGYTPAKHELRMRKRAAATAKYN